MTEGNPSFIISDMDESNVLSKLNLDEDVLSKAGPILVEPVGYLIQASKVVSKPTIQPIINNCREDSLSNAKTELDNYVVNTNLTTLRFMIGLTISCQNTWLDRISLRIR